MNGSALYSDVVLPAATWYEKHDLSSTDLHPFVHSFNPAIPPPWETRTDFDIFKRIAESFTRLAKTHLGVRRDLVAAPLLHDTPDELAQPLGKVLDWKTGECEPIPGKTMPKLVVVERDYGAVLDKWLALGPLVEELGTATKGIALEAARRGRGAAACETAEVDGRPSLEPATSTGARRSSRSPGVTNGRLALEGFRVARAARRRAARRPRRRARRHADRVRRHAGAAAQGDRLARVVGDGVARAPLLAVHDQRRAPRPLAHADRAPAVLRRPRVAARVRRGAAGLPAADRRRSATSASSSPASRAAPRCTSAGSRRTRSGRSTPSSRTTCTC